MTPVILVPLDGSVHALVALPVARALADIEGATVQALHVAERRMPPEHLVRQLGLEPEELHGIVVDVRLGDPGASIVRAAREQRALALVLCTHTGAPTPEGILGPIAERVLLEAPCPLVLVRPERGIAEWSLRTVLLPHDGTPTTSAAIRPAGELAQRAGAVLSVLHVAAPDVLPPFEPGSLPTPRYVDQRQHEWPSWAHEFLERLACLCPVDATQLRLSLARGEPGSETVRFAAQNAVDLIVLAWHGVLEPKHAKVVRTVLHEAPCPVMVVRVGPAAAEG